MSVFVAREPWEILALIDDQTDMDALLASIPPSSPFWQSIRWAIDPQVVLPYHFTILDPLRYGSGVDATVFAKLFQAMLDQRLDAESSAIAIGKLSEASTETQWSWYRRIIEQDVPEGVTVALFNSYAPTEHQIAPLRKYDPAGLTSMDDLPESFLIEPLYEGQLTLWEITNNGSQVDVRGFYQDGSRCRNLLWEDDLRQIGNGRKLPEGLQVEAIAEGDRLWLRDICTGNQFGKKSKTLPLAKRRVLLDQLYQKYLRRSTRLELTESYLGDEVEDVTLLYDQLLQQGFQSVYLRDAQAGYFQANQMDRVIRLDQAGKFFVRDLIPGAEGSKFEKAVWEIICQEEGSGVERYVRLGLSNKLRREMFSHPSMYMSRSFYAKHDGSWMFIQFEKWNDE